MSAPTLVREENQDRNVFVDEFESIGFLEDKVVKRTLWMAPANDKASEATLERQCLQWSSGLVTDVRLRKGPSVKGRSSKNVFFVIEFEDERSVPHLLNY